MKHFTVQFTVCASVDHVMPTMATNGLADSWNIISDDRKLDKPM